MQKRFMDGYVHATPSTLILTIAMDYLFIWLLQPTGFIMRILAFILFVLPDLISTILSFKNFLLDNQDEWRRRNKD